MGKIYLNKVNNSYICGVIIHLIKEQYMDKQVITTINGIEITAVRDENHNIFVPVKPICDAIGVAYQAQHLKLQEHEILAPTITLRVMVAADGKKREMVCLPLEFVYGWIFTINTKNVSEESHDSVLRYQLECYEALYRHFAGSLRRRVEENEAEIAALQAVNDAISREKEARIDRRKAEEHLAAIRKNRLDSSPVLDFD